MANINLKNINKSFGSTHVIKDVSLDIKSESFTVLLDRFAPACWNLQHLALVEWLSGFTLDARQKAVL